jgi:NAD(P)-dependent dehydrogenase (short-subunit alcohol dehydrogenase family)
MSKWFDGKVVLVTGAASGIGKAVAHRFASESAYVAVSDVSEESGRSVVEELTSDGFAASFCHVDVSSADSIRDLIQTVIAQFGRLDCAVNNAGISGPTGTPTADVDESDWDSVMAINLKGIWLSMKYELPVMTAQGGGSIVNMSSVSGLVGSKAAGVAYGASKHGIIGATKTTAVEYAKSGIRVNAVCPGLVLTEGVEKAFDEHPDVAKTLLDMYPMGRFAEPEEIANMVCWLGSDQASFVTGSAFTVDGGFTAQ